MLSKPLKTLELDFVFLEIHENYFISTIKEGVLFDTDKLLKLCKIFDEYFPDRPFGYISDRKFDYSVNPTCYLECKNHTQLKGIAVLCHNDKSYQTAQFERAFYKGPMESFYSREESIKWISSLMGNI